ncbi:MAG TPA: SDR family NAD(P)-dependent oxidoreductase [Puia sp.]|nr:SDR family NAD(P)-dependent oxidoreductase [Puia sp.]
MNISDKTVLITGGGSGIGFETARLLSEKGNRVIITGRNKARLEKAAARLTNTTAIACDITAEADVKKLVGQVQEKFSDLSLLVNNAGTAHAYQLAAGANAFDKAAEEISTNYLSLIRLTELLLPVLSKQKEAAIVNVSSIVVFAAGASIPTYSASKAAVHSYTQSLRHSLSKNTGIKVFELMPPLVNTDFSKEIGGEKGIPPLEVAEGLLAGLYKDEYEIHIGGTAQLYQLFLSSPQNAFNALNQ